MATRSTCLLWIAFSVDTELVAYHQKCLPRKYEALAQLLYGTVQIQQRIHSLYYIPRSGLNPTRLISSDTSNIWESHELMVYCATSTAKQAFEAAVIQPQYWQSGPCFCGKGREYSPGYSSTSLFD